MKSWLFLIVVAIVGGFGGFLLGKASSPNAKNGSGDARKGIDRRAAFTALAKGSALVAAAMFTGGWTPPEVRVLAEPGRSRASGASTGGRGTSTSTSTSSTTGTRCRKRGIRIPSCALPSRPRAADRSPR